MMEAEMPLTKEQVQAIEAMPRETAAKLLAMIRAYKARFLAGAEPLPVSAIDQMVGYVDDKLMGQIVEDNRKAGGVPSPSGLLPPEREEPKVKGSGWAPNIPLSTPPGVEHIDRIADHFAALDRLDMVRQIMGKGEK
jgi:hypothetical protein